MLLIKLVEVLEKDKLINKGLMIRVDESVEKWVLMFFSYRDVCIRMFILVLFV